MATKEWVEAATICHKFRKLERFLYDLEMKTRERHSNNKRTEIERFDWFVERIQNVRGFWLVKRTLG